MRWTWSTLSAGVGVVAAAATAIIALPSTTAIPADWKPILIGTITGLVGVFFPRMASNAQD